MLRGQLQEPNQRRKPPMKMKRARFDTLVTRYYPAVYSFASRLTDDPLVAVLLTHDAFNVARKQLRYRRDEITLMSILLNAVIRAGLAAAWSRAHAMPTEIWLRAMLLLPSSGTSNAVKIFGPSASSFRRSQHEHPPTPENIFSSKPKRSAVGWRHNQSLQIQS